MELLQYSFSLAMTHDMNQVRQRIASKLSIVAGVPGMIWKAWLISEPLPHKSQEKTYAPLYLFENAAARMAFLSSPIYKAVTDAFGWAEPFIGSCSESQTDSIIHSKSCSLSTQVLHDHSGLLQAQSLSPILSEALCQINLIDLSRMQHRIYTFSQKPLDDPDSLLGNLLYEVNAVTCGKRKLA